MTFVRQGADEHVRILAGDLSAFDITPAPTPTPTKAYDPMPIATGKRRHTMPITIPAVITQPPFIPIDNNHTVARDTEHQRVFSDTLPTPTPQTVEEVQQIDSMPIQTGKDVGTHPIPTGKRVGAKPIQTGKRKAPFPLKIKC